jgi:hypothetical protein
MYRFGGYALRRVANMAMRPALWGVAHLAMLFWRL